MGFLPWGQAETPLMTVERENKNFLAPAAARNSGAVLERRKRVRFPWVDICHPWNVGKCVKMPGSCVSSRGVPLRHMCDWRDINNPTAPVCGQDHQRALFHQ
jgi:hypothetical protein